MLFIPFYEATTGSDIFVLISGLNLRFATAFYFIFVSNRT